MNLVKREEFEVLKKMVQKVLIENDELKKAQKKPLVRKKKTIKKKKKAIEPKTETKQSSPKLSQKSQDLFDELFGDK